MSVGEGVGAGWCFGRFKAREIMIHGFTHAKLNTSESSFVVGYCSRTPELAILTGWLLNIQGLNNLT